MTAEAFCAALERCGVMADGHVLAAVSGGADSVALLLLLCEARKRLPISVSCAHMEHGVRGADSLADMAFVRALCEKLNVPCYAAREDAPLFAEKAHIGLEDACRRLRYDFLQRTAREIHADCIATAHHAQDQAETVLMHLLRGSDIAGLCGMRMRNGRIIRPLLEASPQELRAYLRSCGQEWREDATNTDVRYTRNRLRHEILPQLEGINPEIVSALCRVSHAAQRDEAYFTRETEKRMPGARRLINGLAVPKAALCSLDEALSSRLLVRLIACAALPAQRGEVIRQACGLVQRGERAAMNLEGGGRLEIGRKDVFVTGEMPRTPETLLETGGITRTPFGTFSVRTAAASETGDGRLSQVIPLRLLSGARITARSEGERMTPFGLTEPVRVKKLMTDAGIEAIERPSVPALRAKTGEILWLPLVRPARSCERKDGEAALLLTFSPPEME